MAYVVYADVVARYPLLKTYAAENDPSAVNSDMIYYAEIELNGRMGSHFTVPFAGPHPTVKDLTIDLTWYRALRHVDLDQAEALLGLVEERINKIKMGTEYLYTGSGTTIPPQSQAQDIWGDTMNYHPTHSMLDEDDPYVGVSSDMISDEENARL